MKYFILLLFVLFVSACAQKTDYEQLVQRELERDVRYDTIFLGYELGMEHQDFLDHSWYLNQQKIITGGTLIEYPLKNLSSEARMAFFPRFQNNKLISMPIEISFNSWAIWNRELYSNHLINELLEYYEDIYGPEFIYIRVPDLNREAWTKIDGNRRILMYPKDDMVVRVEFLDLSVEQE